MTQETGVLNPIVFYEASVPRGDFKSISLPSFHLICANKSSSQDVWVIRLKHTCFEFTWFQKHVTQFMLLMCDDLCFVEDGVWAAVVCITE